MYKVCFKCSQTFSKGAQPVAPSICKYPCLKGPSFIDILPKFHDIYPTLKNQWAKYLEVASYILLLLYSFSHWLLYEPDGEVVR